MSENAGHLEAGTLVAGKFRILRLLGAGGMGAVYEIEHELTKHRRALKLLHAQYRAYPAVVTRFLREASAAGRIGNPHIIETFDAGELDSGEPYLVMEMLEGRTLSDELGAHGTLPVPQLASLLRQACIGVQAAHEAGIVHRDLKPENLFIITKDRQPFVKILDFGVSKFDAELTGGMGVTKEGSALGTPFYMPPEQVRGQTDLDARADIYALGVILYECASGRRPYEAETLPHLALLIHEGKPHHLAELRPDLPPGFTEIVHRAMSSDRAERFQSARELADALAPYADEALGATIASDAPIVIPAPSGGAVGPHGTAVQRSPIGPKGTMPAQGTLPLQGTMPIPGTMGGAAVSVDDEAPPAKSRLGIAIAAAVAVVAIGGGVAFKLLAHPAALPIDASAAVAASASAAPSATIAAAPASAAPSATATSTALVNTPPAATAARPLSNGNGTHAAAVAAPPAATPPPATPPAAPPETRRTQTHGLDTKNPF